MTDLTEKLKELLMECDWKSITPTMPLAEMLALQLAPEIEKLMPRWIPVSERLPDDLQCVDIINKGNRWADMIFIKRNFGGDIFTCVDRSVELASGMATHWMPIMKGPMG